MTEPNEVLSLVRELIEGMNRTLASHKQALDKLNANMEAALAAGMRLDKTVELHAAALQNLRPPSRATPGRF